MTARPRVSAESGARARGRGALTEAVKVVAPLERVEEDVERVCVGVQREGAPQHLVKALRLVALRAASARAGEDAGAGAGAGARARTQ
jgi:hypothetical protein